MFVIVAFVLFVNGNAQFITSTTYTDENACMKDAEVVATDINTNDQVKEVWTQCRKLVIGKSI